MISDSEGRDPGSSRHRSATWLDGRMLIDQSNHTEGFMHIPKGNDLLTKTVLVKRGQEVVRVDEQPAVTDMRSSDGDIIRDRSKPSAECKRLSPSPSPMTALVGKKERDEPIGTSSRSRHCAGRLTVRPWSFEEGEATTDRTRMDKGHRRDRRAYRNDQVAVIGIQWTYEQQGDQGPPGRGASRDQVGSRATSRQ
jgi:hypothetical protein